MSHLQVKSCYVVKQESASHSNFFLLVKKKYCKSTHIIMFKLNLMCCEALLLNGETVRVENLKMQDVVRYFRKVPEIAHIF